MAALSKEALYEKWSARFADNTTRQIDEGDFREFTQDLTDSLTSVFGGTSVISWKNPCAVATTANITLSGEQTIDGVLTSASRVLVRAQSTASQNGVYVSAAGAWTRATDVDTASELEGAAVGITSGSTLANTQWHQTATSITVGTTSLTWQQIGFGVSAQNLLQVLTQGNAAGSLRITGLADPVDAQDAATKAYVLSNGGGTIEIEDLPDNAISYVDDSLSTYVFSDADHLKIKVVTRASGQTLTAPVGLPTGWSTTVYRKAGAGTVTLASAGTYEGTDTTLGSEKTWASIVHLGSNVHAASGALGSLGLTIGTIDSQTKSANGGVLSASSLYFQNADATYPGLMSATTQTIAGNKTFNGSVGVGGATPETKLDVYSTANQSEITVRTDAAAQVGVKLKRTVNTASTWEVYIPNGSTDLRFFNTADRVSISSAGVTTLHTAPTTSTTADVLGRNSSTGAIERRTDITSGTYTPTLTNITNVDSSTAYSCQYMRVGSTVTVSGKILINPTASGASTEVRMTLPIASDFSDSNHCAGTGKSAGTNAYIYAEATNNLAGFVFTSTGTIDDVFYFHHTYRVI